MPEKDLTAVKVQQQISAELEKMKTNSYTPNLIVSAPAISVDQKVIGAAAEIVLRKPEVIRSIDFKADSLVLILYDNAIVDGDTVGVILNDEEIIPKKGLSEKVFRKVIKKPRFRRFSTIGDVCRKPRFQSAEYWPADRRRWPDRQEMRFEGDMKKSSAVILKRKRHLMEPAIG